MINYQSIPEFEKDFKALAKRFKTLHEDFEILKKFVLELYYLHGIDSKAFVPIKGFCQEKYESNKIKKFTCKALKGNGAASGLRVIFVWDKQTQTITFVEIYFKADQENENKGRLKNFLKQSYTQ